MTIKNLMSKHEILWSMSQATLSRTPPSTLPAEKSDFYGSLWFADQASAIVDIKNHSPIRKKLIIKTRKLD